MIRHIIICPIMFLFESENDIWLSYWVIQINYSGRLLSQMIFTVLRKKWNGCHGNLPQLLHKRKQYHLNNRTFILTLFAVDILDAISWMKFLVQIVAWRRTNADPIHWRIYVAIGGDELTILCEWNS